MEQTLPLSRFQLLTRYSLIAFAWTLPISQVPIQLAAGLALLGWLGEGIFNKNWEVRWHPVFWPLMFYLAWNVLCSALSPRPWHSLSQLPDNEWQVVIMLMLFWTVREASDLRSVLSGFFVTSGVAMLYAIWQTLTGVELLRAMDLIWVDGVLFRSVGFYNLSLTFAAFAMVVFFLSTALALATEGNERRWLTALSALTAVTLVGTFSRGIWLAAALLLPVYLVFRLGRRGMRWSAVLVVVMLAIVVLVPEVRMRAVASFDMSKTDNATRLNLWKTTVSMWQAHPVLGIGEDNYDYYFEAFRVPGHYESTAHPHSDYLNVLVNAGVPGLLAFCAIWGIALRTGWRSARRAADGTVRAIAIGATLALGGFLIAAFTQDYYGTFLNTWHWWFVVGLIFATSRLGGEVGEMAK